MIHQSVEKAVLSAGYRDLSVLDELVIPLKTFDEFILTLAGHIHKQQGVQKNPPVVYVGSLDRVDFNEANEAKGFMLYDTATKKLNFIKLDVREFLDLKIDTTIDPTKLESTITTVLESADLKEKIVRTIIKVNDIDISRININEINKILKQAWFAKDVALDIVRTKRTRNEGISESLTVEQALVEWCRKEEYTTIADEMLKVGREIITKVGVQ
jgi:exonuclease SbcD